MRALPWVPARKAGDAIPCPRCKGKGYELRGLTGDYPVECERCGGSGSVKIAKGR